MDEKSGAGQNSIPVFFLIKTVPCLIEGISYFYTFNALPLFCVIKKEIPGDTNEVSLPP
jgi:hypothetical protein